MKQVAAILGTADTKEEELLYLRELIEAEGFKACLIDVGIFSFQPCKTRMKADIDSRTVSSAGGADISELRSGMSRDGIISVMGKGAGKILSDMNLRGELGGVIAIGGNQGSAIAAMAMRSLPIGMPKVLVSTVASGNIRPFIGHRDIMVLFSVADMTGALNSISRVILKNAAGALTGMLKINAGAAAESGKRSAALTALGNTQGAVDHIIRRLKEKGISPVAFHASGAGGSAMEELIEQGYFSALIDLTPHEISEEVMGMGIYQPTRPGRMSAAGKKGIPQVVSTGGLEYLCFGEAETIPERLRGHKCYMHNPYNANVALEPDEIALVAAEMAARLNASSGKVSVLIPLRGWSVYGAPGGPLYSPETYSRFINVLRQSLNTAVAYEEIDAAINDQMFADKAADELFRLLV